MEFPCPSLQMSTFQNYKEEIIMEKEKSIEEIKEAYIRKYPELSRIRGSHHNFVFNALRLTPPDGITLNDMIRLYRTKHSPEYTI